MNEREQILNSIEQYNIFLIPSRREIYSTVCDVSELTKVAKELFREGLIDWSVVFDKNSNWIILNKARELSYDLAESEQKRILDRIKKTGYYRLNSRIVSKIKKWSDILIFLKSLCKENKLDWGIDFESRRYIFYKLEK